jgi:hypothetical protein
MSLAYSSKIGSLMPDISRGKWKKVDNFIFYQKCYSMDNHLVFQYALTYQAHASFHFLAFSQEAASNVTATPYIYVMETDYGYNW